MNSNPYTSLPPEAFWKSGVSEVSPLAPRGLYKKKWPITASDKIATAGSCFAQHIGRRLRQSGFQVLDFEPAPSGLRAEDHSGYGFSMYSARYGNIYTVRQLLQLAQEAFGERNPGEVVWENNGRFYDALRPSVEPDGLDSADEVLEQRDYHLRQVRKMFIEMDLFVFTLGLTEAWVDKYSGTVYPTAPGVIAGCFDPVRYELKNFNYSEVIDDFITFMRLIVAKQSSARCCKYLLTVSPVPLTATASNLHVLLATTYSKSVLRAVAGQLSIDNSDIDYFPSYEIISSSWTRGIFYESNLRSVSSQGVDVVMKVFFDEHGSGCKPDSSVTSDKKMDAGEQGRLEIGEVTTVQDSDVQCEESLLKAFNK